MLFECLHCGVAFKGRDESSTSVNRRNFLEILDVVVLYDKKVVKMIAKTLKNMTYTSPQIQKEILHVFSTKMMNAIREEIGAAKFCIIVDEAHDESVTKQIAIVLRFIDKNGFCAKTLFWGCSCCKHCDINPKKNDIFFVISL